MKKYKKKLVTPLPCDCIIDSVLDEGNYKTLNLIENNPQNYLIGVLPKNYLDKMRDSEVSFYFASETQKYTGTFDVLTEKEIQDFPEILPYSKDYIVVKVTPITIVLRYRYRRCY